jgi:hypothetical protein
MKHMWMVLVLLGIAVSHANSQQLKLVNEWKSVDFNFPTERHRQEAITNRVFIPGNAVPIDVDVQYKGLLIDFDGNSKIELTLRLFTALGFESRIFITFPRFREGIPITLGTRSNKKASDSSDLIDPYPDYTWHENPTQDCKNKLVSVFRIAVSKFQFDFHSLD